MHDLPAVVDLLDWKRRVFAMYAKVRSSDEPQAAWDSWRQSKDELFRTHPQSPIPEDERQSFEGLKLFYYDESYRVLADMEPTDPESYDVPTSSGEQFSFDRVGVASFELMGESHSLELYWLTAYGGGLFVPFRDETSGKETYGAGRYLLDTVKGADLGMSGHRLVLDFNFAYNPSCSYDSKWVCPLAPPPNRLQIEVRTGERHEDKL
jgi:uncharacterized protein (DUF1684 family)